MSSNMRIEEFNPPEDSLDESYWASLLTDGENPPTVSPEFSPAGNDHEPGISLQTAQSPEPNISDWEEIRHIMESDTVLQLKVVGYNRGGLLVEWHSLRGFVPASQLVSFPETQHERERRAALIEHVGESLQLRIIELDRDKNRLIFSQRAAQVAPGTREYVLATLRNGDQVSGSVTNVCEFGAFVDLGGVEGLIHISELSWGRVAHPSDFLSRGEVINAVVLDIDSRLGRVALSIKRLHPDPWITVQQRYQVGEIVEGRITNVVDFGAFACIEVGLEGLIHFSELAEGHFLHPRNVVTEGENVRARIISIDGVSRRLGLSLRLL
jgi:small subunit ribosomal protein S1